MCLLKTFKRILIFSTSIRVQGKIKLEFLSMQIRYKNYIQAHFKFT